MMSAKRHWLTVAVLALAACSEKAEAGATPAAGAAAGANALGVGKPKSDAVTAALRRAATDAAFARAVGITGKFHEARPEASDPPAGLKGNFYWSSRPDGVDAEITIFDTAENAKAAFELFKEDDSPSSLLLPTADGMTEFNSYRRAFDDRTVETLYHCAGRDHIYSCGSIPQGVPAIITVRLGTNASKMFDDSKTSADRLIQDYKVDKSTRDVEDTLHRLGLVAAGAVK